MIYVVTAIRDSVSRAFVGNVNLERSQAEAIRNFDSSIISAHDNGGLLDTHKGDFDLYVLGSFDTENGVFTNEQELLRRGAEVV